MLGAITAINALQRESSTLKKQEVLRRFKDNEDFRKLLYYALNPMLTYKVSEQTLSRPVQYNPAITLVLCDIYTICETLSQRRAVDDVTLYQVCAFLDACAPHEKEFYTKTYSQQNNDEQVFYQTVWTLISESILFDTNAKKVFALYFVLIDKRIPYFKIDDSILYSMSNDRFTELLQQSAREGQRIRYILKSDFSQKTQKASVLLNELGISLPASDNIEEINSYEMRLMQVVYILREMESDRLASLLTRLGH